ncbi:hypothetical protein G6F46_001014 [Rhizopus delemar]|nr:hypothetical protein G6F54_008263 [Rhizopus delemar]KAG1508105.1 hypothetical protein G6F53_008450 [Rhizopus delemar]KAG1549102.1 hypothetical protein G6F49_009696 [Rhizopus delemar]KAG1584528.1 hypothetical protein G6F48_007834 [Rhizopus delemar]KAG1591050.1 hypothetical protein G6F47_009859 [Rhizopus delemar]
MDTEPPVKQTQEEFEEIDTTLKKPKLELKENVSLLDRGKGHSKSQTPLNNMTRDQIKYCGAIMRNLKKHRDAAPFLQPVDYVKLNIPDYPKIIRHPMDLATVDKKLNSGQYDSVDQWIYDVRLVFNNCFKFNGPEAMVSMLCQNVESAFEKSLRQMPPNKNTVGVGSRSASPYVEYDEEDDEEGSAKKKRKKNKMTEEEEVRPKRKIHPPPSKDYPETMTKRRNPRKNDAQMKFCAQALKELKKTKYRDINYPFLHPVDVVGLNIPDYVDIVKHPMDLSTIEKKLNDGEYAEPEDFENDIRLMFNNCYLYNPPSLPVHKMGRQLEKAFDDKWAQRPPKTEPTPLVDDAPEEEFDEVVEEDDSEDERDQKIAELERHIATISQQIASIKSQKRKKGAEKPRRTSNVNKTIKEKKPSAPKEKRRRTSTTNKKKEKKEELPEFTFDQKKDLSERINNLTGDRLNTVVDIIRSSMPNLDGQGQEEIVLDIDSLDRSTLHRLHEFVTGESLLKHKKSPLAKKQRNYGEHAADRKIRELEKTLQKFNSDSSSESGESGSESGSESDDSASSSD